MAEVVAGFLTSAVVKIAGDKLSSAIAEQGNLAWNFSDHLQDMKDTMESIAAVLKDAEKKSVETEQARLWLKRLKNAAHGISDMMDNYQDQSAQQIPRMFSCLPAARNKMVLANEMKNMREELRKINEQRVSFNFTVNVGANLEQQHYHPRETASAVNETTHILGRDGKKKEIVDILSASLRKDGTMVLPIYGLGGMGKTTLAQLVYNDTQFKQYEHRAWVYVSQEFDLKKIGRSIISQISPGAAGQQNLDELHMIHRRLDNLLPGKKTLIVLDDLWEEKASELDKLKGMLHVGKKGSMVDVLATTRSETIAKDICTDEPHKLQPLEDLVCWDIIKRHSGFEHKSNKQNLEQIGLDFAKKCRGVPLAAQALGYILNTEDLDGWSEMNKNNIWNNQSTEVVLPSLRLSYERMLPILRLCFSYCAIFPKGHNINEDDLIYQWISLDFIEKPSDGKKYIKQLLGMSFLQYKELPDQPPAWRRASGGASATAPARRTPRPTSAATPATAAASSGPKASPTSGCSWASARTSTSDSPPRISVCNMSVHASEGSGTDDSIDDHTSAQRSRGRRSKVWEHFESDLVNVGGDLKAVCKYCRLQLHTKSGTSSLRGHIADSCPIIEEDVRKQFVSTMKKLPLEGSFVFDPQVCRERLVNFCIHAEVPFNKFEDPYLQPWLDSLQPEFKVKGRQTIRDDCFKRYNQMKKDLQDELNSLSSRVCITSDMWTSSQNLGYMAVTAHYIDADFRLKKKVISFKEVKYPHTGYAIEEAIVSSLTDWGIRGKLFTVTVDNASNNTAACEELVKNNKSELLCEGEHLHVRCCAHILNILVQDGMKIIQAAISKIRELLKHIDSSPSRLQTFNSLANAHGLPPKHGIYIDIPNRWNATFKMLREALSYKSALNSYANQNLELSLSQPEWEKAESICDFLKAFEELTLTVSAHRRPTSHKFLPMVLCIRHALRDPHWQVANTVLKDLAALMQVKLDKYWDPYEDFLDPREKNREIEFNLALVIATILDPRRKDVYLEFFYEKVVYNLNQISELIDSALKCMKKYFDEYQQLARTRTSAASLSQQSCEHNINVSSPIAGKRKLEEEFAQHKSRRKYTRTQKSELDIYLEEETEQDSEDFDILAWWKINAKKFPILSTMACDFLAIPLSTVASESAFSCGGRILGDTRSSLNPEMLEALVCAKDWLYKPKQTNNEGMP